MESSEENSIWEHARKILRSPRIQNKPIILCEGEIQERKSRNPSSYALREKVPDSKFYKDCLPSKYSREHCPVFVNCGGRSDVIKTFQAISWLLEEDSEKYYISHTDNLFVIIDLDLSPNTIEEYQYSNTEKIFEALYPNFIRLTGNTKNHKIFTTGLIHREAYFVLPQLLDVYKEFYPKVMYRGKILELRSIYEVALSHILENRGLKKNYEVIKNRFTRLGMNLPENIMDLEEYCKENFFLKNSDLMPIELLLFSNIKELFWKELEFEGGNDIFLKDQLEMQIAKFFSSHLDEVFHIRHILDRICQPYHSEG